MLEVRWVRVAIAVVIGLAIILGTTYLMAKNNPVNDVDIDLAMKGCSVIFAPDGSYEIVKFGDPRCP